MQLQQPMNRAQRRQLARSAAARPPQPARQVSADNLQLALLRATRLTRAERESILEPVRAGFKALREGVATYLQWANVSSAITVALAIEDQGTVRGLREHLDAAERAIDAVYWRVMQADGEPSWGRRTTLYFHEIDALREAIHLHDVAQLQNLSAAEFHAALRVAERNVLALGGKAIPRTDPLPPRPVQEQLL